jgi:hypothetical protein
VALTAQRIGVHRRRLIVESLPLSAVQPHCLVKAEVHRAALFRIAAHLPFAPHAGRIPLIGEGLRDAQLINWWNHVTIQAQRGSDDSLLYESIELNGTTYPIKKNIFARRL